MMDEGPVGRGPGRGDEELAQGQAGGVVAGQKAHGAGFHVAFHPGTRAGQENLPAIAGMGLAAELAAADLEARSSSLASVRDTLLEKLPAAIDDVIVTGHLERRLPDVASFCVKYIEGEGLLLFLDNAGIMAASGSACTSRALKSSHVLEAIGLDAATAQGSIIFTLGTNNTNDNAEAVVSAMKPIVSRLREMSPLYQKRKENGSLQ